MTKQINPRLLEALGKDDLLGTVFTMTDYEIERTFQIQYSERNDGAEPTTNSIGNLNQLEKAISCQKFLIEKEVDKIEAEMKTFTESRQFEILSKTEKKAKLDEFRNARDLAEDNIEVLGTILWNSIGHRYPELREKTVIKYTGNGNIYVEQESESSHGICQKLRNVVVKIINFVLDFT
jgi:hypothetical protein